jgi:hypothetical protein
MTFFTHFSSLMGHISTLENSGEYFKLAVSSGAFGLNIIHHLKLLAIFNLAI